MLIVRFSIAEVIGGLKDASNGLNYHQFCAAMGWVEDDYSADKFLQFQAIGRALASFDYTTLRTLIEFQASRS